MSKKFSRAKVTNRVLSIAFLLFLSFVLVLMLFVSYHHCNEDNCIICLLSSNVTAWCVSIKVVFALMLVITELSIHKVNNHQSETLITLKRKLTI